MPQHFQTVDEYINSFEGVPRQRLEEMRQLVRQEVPDAEERISYNIPAYFVDSKRVIYFAGYDKHIGIYPIRTRDKACNKLMAPYAHGKATARFPHDQELPAEVIKQFIRVCLKEAGAKK